MEIFPKFRGENKNIYLKPPTSFSWCKIPKKLDHGKIPVHQGFVKCVFWLPSIQLFLTKNSRGFQLYTGKMHQILVFQQPCGGNSRTLDFSKWDWIVPRGSASRCFSPRHCERSSTFCLRATAVSHESNLQEAKVSNYPPVN